MAKAVADTDSESNQGGFTTDGSKVIGFSSMHDSGTGGSPSLGDFQLFPYASCVNDTVDGCVFMKSYRATNYQKNSVKASPGYFGLTLESGVQAEMTTAFHTALYRFSFPASGQGGSPLILLDLTDLSDSRQDNATINIDPDTGRMSGHSRFLPSFGTGNYVAYFCVDFHGSSVRDGGIWVNSRGSDKVEHLKISRGINSAGPLPGGGFVRFNSHDPVLARVGLSFQSTEQACSVAESEIPDFAFEKTRSTAVAAWQEKLSPITVSRNMINGTMLKNFYSGIYRTVS
jgi:putative alpha-1,2-mannosidase